MPPLRTFGSSTFDFTGKTRRRASLPKESTTAIDYVIVGGGGGGGRASGGGGGAGGFRTGTSLSVASVSAYTITIGGGAGARKY